MKRIKLLSIIFAILLLFVYARVFSISIIHHHKYSLLAKEQQRHETIIKSARKILYDRNMIPLTDTTSALYGVVICEKCPDIQKVIAITGITLPEEGIQIFPMPSDKTLQQQLLKCEGVSTLSLPVRYPENNLFCHLIGYGGYTNGSGLEKALDNSLITDNNHKIYTQVDAQNHPLQTQGYYNPNQWDLSGVKLTVDMHIQKICEDVMDQLCPKGAVVVTDVKSGDILAMVSRPAYSQTDPAAYFDKGGSELLNRAISSYDMGSVFKVLITGAALEEGFVNPDDKFICSGKVQVDNMEFQCNQEDGHGEITFTQGFAQSCNIPFYELGQKLGWKTIRKYADKIGFGKNIIDLALDESKGVLPDIVDSAPALANLSIGQGNMNGTPLQVAQMIQAVANGGEKTPLAIIDGKLGPDGKAFKKSGRTESERIFSTKTALRLRSLMTETVENGTGSPAKSNTVSIAGKTGSAETGWMVGEETLTHGWFAGFFPADNPRYVCVVLCENGQWGGSSAGPIFKKIAEQISGLY